MAIDARQSTVFLACVLWSAATAAVDLPMAVEDGRPYVDVTLTAVDGHPITAHAWLDTGGGSIILSRRLAEAAGYKPTGPVSHEEGAAFAPLAAPAMSIGGMPLQLAEVDAIEDVAAGDHLQETDADMALPVRALAKYDVVFDYPAGRFSVSQASAARHTGAPMDVYIGPSGMPVVTLEVDGKPYGFLLDTGGSCVMLSSALMDAWSSKHADWARIQGAYGPGDMFLGGFETQLSMLRIARLGWGGFALQDVAAVSRAVGNYEQFMSKIVDRPVVGSIGGNLLQAFRVEIDYPARKLYLARRGDTAGSIDMVGVILEPVPGGGYEVAAVDGGTGGLAVGDRLLKVGGLDVSQAAAWQVIAALSGKPGESRLLVVQRGAQPQPLDLMVPVEHIL